MFDDDEITIIISALRLAWLNCYDDVEGKIYRELEDKLRQRLKINYSAEVWTDEVNSVNLKLHFRHGNWQEAKKALIKFRNIIQERLDLERNCPYFEEINLKSDL